MIIDEENIRVQYESTKESPILRDDVLPYPYRYTEKDQIYVLEGITELTREQDFTVSYDGSVTILKDIPAGTVLTIYRSTPLDQGSEFPQEAPFSSKKIEDALDKLTMQNQEQREALSRALKLPMTASTGLSDLEMPTPEPNRSVKWNAEGTALINTNFDPDTALEQTEKFKKEAEQAAKDAVAAKESITITEETLVNTAKQATDEITALAEETQETIVNASKHKLNSKEIGTFLTSPAPQSDSDVHVTDGSFITKDDDCYSEFHTNWATTQRNYTDVTTDYFKYQSYNYSRVWYSTVQSSPDRFYGLTDIINGPAGSWYLLDKTGTPISKPSIEVKSYYKYQLINAVGHEAPDYLLWQVFADEKQLEEPTTEHCNEFFAFSDDERVGAKLENITNIVVLPPDVTSEYRRIQFTQVSGENTYYYYYNAIPVEIHAYMNGTIADLNLNGAAGVQTNATVVKPYLCTTHKGVYQYTINPEFLSTREYCEMLQQGSDFSKLYTNTPKDKTYEIRLLHDDVRLTGSLVNKAGVFSGFSATQDYLSIDAPFPMSTSFEGTTSRELIQTAEIVINFTAGMRDTASSNTSVLLSRHLATVPGWFIGLVGGLSTAAAPNKIQVVLYSAGSTQAIAAGAFVSTDEIEPWVNYTLKLSYQADTNTLSMYLAKEEEPFALQATYTIAPDVLTQYWNVPMDIGSNGIDRYFRGSIDLTKSFININGKYLWGGEENKKVAYAFDGDKCLGRHYGLDHEYYGCLASNVYETKPIGYTLLSSGVMSEDGWIAPSSGNQAMSLTVGTTTTSRNITLYQYDTIHLKGRIRTNKSSSATFGHWGLGKSAGTTPCPILFGVNNKNTLYVWVSRTSSTAWAKGDYNTGLPMKLNTEYLVECIVEQTKKYKEVTTGTFEEATDGTLYKYTVKLTEWSIDNSIEPLSADFYLTYNFGGSSFDAYQVQGLQPWNYNLNITPYINYYSWTINDIPLFEDNIHVVDRPANSTALPNIKETEDGVNTYIVVANGVEEEIILAEPKAYIDNYLATSVTPSLETLSSELQQNITASYTQYNKNLTNTYQQGIKSLQNASDAVRKSDLQEVRCVIETFVDGYSWYRRWSDGWLEQGGYASAAATIYLLCEYRDTYYTCITTPVAAADPYVTGRTVNTFAITGGAAFWKTEGYEA